MRAGPSAAFNEEQPQRAGCLPASAPSLSVQWAPLIILSPLTTPFGTRSQVPPQVSAAM